MQIKSHSVEKACIEIINRLVDEVQVSDLDENNKRKFQLPFNENATPEFMRKEELLPIDKYDWINFEKLYKPVNFPNPKVHRKLCNFFLFFPIGYNGYWVYHVELYFEFCRF